MLGGGVEEALILRWTWRGAPTVYVCPLIMAGKAAAARDRDVPRPNCYIYAKKGSPSTRSRSVMPGPTVLLNPRGPVPPSSTWKRSLGGASPNIPEADEKLRRERIEERARTNDAARRRSA